MGLEGLGSGHPTWMEGKAKLGGQAGLGHGPHLSRAME